MDTHVQNISRILSTAHTDSIWSIWRRPVLHFYSLRKLTVSTDIFVALSAIATVFQAKTGGTYMAGLWKEDFIRELTWSFAEGGRSRAASYIPSWSWASIDSSWIGHWDSSGDVDQSTELAELVEINAHPASTNPFGLVSYGLIKLQGMSMEALLSPTGNPVKYVIKIPSGQVGYLKLDTPPVPVAVILSDGTVERTVRRALPDEETGGLNDVVGVGDFTVWLVVLLSYRSGERSVLCALVLARMVSSPTEYQRIGRLHYLPERTLENMERRVFSIV